VMQINESLRLDPARMSSIKSVAARLARVNAPLGELSNIAQFGAYSRCAWSAT